MSLSHLYFPNHISHFPGETAAVTWNPTWELQWAATLPGEVRNLNISPNDGFWVADRNLTQCWNPAFALVMLPPPPFPKYNCVREAQGSSHLQCLKCKLRSLQAFLMESTPFRVGFTSDLTPTSSLMTIKEHVLLIALFQSMKPGLLLQILGSQWSLLQQKWAVRKGFCLSSAPHGRILFASSPIWWVFISAHTSLTVSGRWTGTAELTGDTVTENSEAKGSRAGEEINCYMCYPFSFFFNLMNLAGGEQFSQTWSEINEWLSCKTAEPSTETRS